MTNHGLHHEGGWGDKTPTETEDKWQKHVIIALWLLFGLLIAVAGVFLWTSTRGSVGSPIHQTIPSWPVNWP